MLEASFCAIRSRSEQRAQKVRMKSPLPVVFGAGAAVLGAFAVGAEVAVEPGLVGAA